MQINTNHPANIASRSEDMCLKDIPEYGGCFCGCIYRLSSFDNKYDYICAVPIATQERVYFDWTAHGMCDRYTPLVEGVK